GAARGRRAGAHRLPRRAGGARRRAAGRPRPRRDARRGDRRPRRRRGGPRRPGAGGGGNAMRMYVLAALVARAGCKKSEPRADDEVAEPVVPVAVTCAPVTTATVTDEANLRGIIAAPPDRQATVAPATAGRIAEIHVREGDKVKKGDVLAVID